MTTEHQPDPAADDSYGAPTDSVTIVLSRERYRQLLDDLGCYATVLDAEHDLDARDAVEELWQLITIQQGE